MSPWRRRRRDLSAPAAASSSLWPSSARKLRRYLVGTSGFIYPHWRGRFYPQGLPQSRWFAHYAQHFATVELNNPFYRLPSEAAFQAWRHQAPPGFVYAVKASRFITHLKKLKGVEEAVGLFISRARLLGEALGPILYQLPPNLHRHDELLDTFLAILPQDLQHVVEFRHSSWFAPEVFGILRERRVGFCVMHLHDLPCPVEVTADFTYFRFHGPAGLYWGSYSDEELRAWAGRMAALGPEVRTVYAYFNNDAEAYAVANAQTLAHLLELA